MTTRRRKQPHLNEATTTLHRTWGEVDYSVTLHYRYTPGRAAILNRPMPDCHPEEPEEFEVLSITYEGGITYQLQEKLMDTYSREHWEEQLSDHFAQSGDTPC